MPAAGGFRDPGNTRASRSALGGAEQRASEMTDGYARTDRTWLTRGERFRGLAREEMVSDPQDLVQIEWLR